MTTENTKVFDFIDALEALLYEWWDDEWGYNHDTSIYPEHWCSSASGGEEDGIAMNLYVGSLFREMQKWDYRGDINNWDQTPIKEK